MPSPKILKANHAHRLSVFLPVVLAVIGIVLVLLRNHPYGPGLHFDAVNYIGVARNLLAGKGWVQFHGGPFVVAPPAYPALLALFGWLSGFDPRAIAGPLNALLFGLTVFVAARWLLERITFRWLALWGGLAAAFSLPLTTIASHAMTQPAFILFITLALFYMDRYLRGGGRSALMWAGLFTALAWLTRYTGVAAAITLPLFLLPRFFQRPRTRLKQLAVIFGLIASIPIGLLIRDHIVWRFHGWPPARFTLSDFLEASLSAMGRWILPDLSQEAAMALAAVMLFALAVTLGFALVRKPPGWQTFCLCSSFTLIFFILMGITIMITEYDVIQWHSRYWTPMYIPLLIALVFALDRLLIWLRNAVRPPALKTFVSGVIALLLIIWLGDAVELNRMAIISSSQGNDKYYAGPHVVNNKVIQFIREASASDKIFINDAYYSRWALLYIATDRPLADFHWLPQDLEQLPQMVETAAPGDLLIWLHDPRLPYSYGLPELEAMPALERIANLQSGVVFRINRL